MSTTNVVLDLLHDNPYQPRLVDDPAHIENLARSIAADGLQQHPKARKVEVWYQLAFGHSRRKAFEWLVENYEAQGLPDRYDGYTCMPVEIEDLSDEAMFRLAVTENVQRKDLDPIEMAKSMKAYRDQFGKTSAEIGALYGMSDATVRGMIRLLELPEPAQGLLSKGMISQATARTLLSVQKILDEKTISTLLTKIANASADDHEGLIENAIERREATVEMWSRWNSERGEKPRAGSDGWLLDMKNFPNKMLAPLSHADLNAIGVQDTSSSMTLVTRCLNGEDAYVPPELKMKIDHLVNPPACNACPFYAMVNKAHYCGVRICYQRKTTAFKAQKLADMSRTLKIAIYQESDGAYLILDEDVASHKKAFGARHADLRLVPTSAIKGYAYQRFEGADSSTAKIVAVGESASRLAVSPRMKTVGGKKTEKEKAEMRAMRVYRARRLELDWEYTATAQAVFEGVPLKVLEKLRGWHYVGVDDAIPDKYTHLNTGGTDGHLAFARRSLAWALVIGQSSHYTRSKLVKILESFEAITGVKASKVLMASVQEWDAEIEQLATPVAAETPAKKAKK